MSTKQHVIQQQLRFNLRQKKKKVVSGANWKINHQCPTKCWWVVALGLSITPLI